MLTQPRALLVLRGIGLAGVVIGGACLVAPGRVSSAAGLPADSGTRWALRLFGVRDVALGAALAVAPAAPAALPRALAMVVAVAQAGDLAVTAAMFLRRQVPAAAALAVLAGAPATAVAALAARHALTEGA